ncbi:MAG: hypothetical protein IMZ64_06945 [Bacteroidetes bacterium]|nr:hypothetical protein [Bacteroidota bacterium]
MRRTYVYFISLLFILFSSLIQVNAQDTILIPLKIKVGLEVSGPAIYFSEKTILNAEGYIAADINEKVSAVFGAGYLNYKYSQYNYNYLNKGMFVRTGVDFNLLKPDKSLGKYWAGIGLRYGLSLFTSEVPSFQKENYWGTTSSSIAKKTNWGHFVEVSPGVRAEVFKNLSMGWTISLRMLLYTGTGKDLRPIYFPGFGNGGKTVSKGINYFIVWNIPYKKINVIIKKEVPEETEDTGETGNGQQATGIRQ